MKEKMQLVDQIVVSEKDENFSALDKLCFLSKNLYNVANYNIRQEYINSKKYLDYFAVNNKLHDIRDVDYYAMPYTQMSQQVLKQVDTQYKAMFKALKSEKMRGKRIRLPKYKDKENGRNIAVYTNQVIKVQDGCVRLKVDKENFIHIPTKREDIQQVRVVPRGNHVVIEIVYNVEYELKGDNNRYASIDLGVSNVCTLSSNAGQSVIFNGRPLKSVNAWYNKKKAKLQFSLNRKKHTSKRIKRLTGKRNRK